MLDFERTTQEQATWRGRERGSPAASEVHEIRAIRRFTELDSSVNHAPLTERGREFREV